jgi:hypothetical protein
MIQAYGRIDPAHGNKLFGDNARAAVLNEPSGGDKVSCLLELIHNL